MLPSLSNYRRVPRLTTTEIGQGGARPRMLLQRGSAAEPATSSAAQGHAPLSRICPKMTLADLKSKA
ncbi:MAG: hypothetical protein QOD94_3218 [Alphaproteobacteria bacterium]|jgi:hypothetical protein|nr:hypothetical protein [Alphaproteobacteria bacterium]